MSGLRGYQNSGDWTWEHWPPPFDQWAPVDSVAQPAPVLGLGGLGCGACRGGCGDPMGLGQTGTGLFGTGLFVGGPSTWGFGEWATVAAGIWVGSKVLGSHPAVRSGRKRVGSAASAGVGTLGNIALLGAAGYAAWWAYSQYGPQLGLGDYQAQGFATPQILAAPVSNRSSALSIPIGY
jgi:hypothetical protein